jgi:hypothetical protein
MDFTLAKYDALCAALVLGNYRCMTHADFMQSGAGNQRIALLRHDVDSRPGHAVKLATIERDHGLRATYYFRTRGRAFDADAIRAIHGLGHEVGYHYETLTLAGGDVPQALERFRADLALLRELAPIRTASMHGSPLSRWDNRAIWQDASPADFDLIGEAYRDIDYTAVVYLNDTGRTWNPTRYNLRDVTDVIPRISVESTDDLIATIRAGTLQQVVISCHPERWQSNPVVWFLQAGRDVTLNMVKVVLKRLR